MYNTCAPPFSPSQPPWTAIRLEKPRKKLGFLNGRGGGPCVGVCLGHYSRADSARGNCDCLPRAQPRQRESVTSSSHLLHDGPYVVFCYRKGSRYCDHAFPEVFYLENTFQLRIISTRSSEWRRPLRLVSNTPAICFNAVSFTSRWEVQAPKLAVLF